MTDFMVSSKVRVIIAFCALLLITLLLRTLFRIFASPLRHIPGPFAARLSRVWYLRKVWNKNWEKKNILLHRKYGKIVRITPYEYSINDPEAIKIIYGHGTDFVKSPWYAASGDPDPHKGDLFTEQDSKVHAAARRKVAKLYSVSSLLQMEHCVDECTNTLMTIFGDFARSGTRFDMQHWMQRYAFDLISLITLSKRFGFLENVANPTEVFSALHSYLIYVTRVGVYSELHPILFRLLGLLPSPSGSRWLSLFVEVQIKDRILSAREEKGDTIRSDDFLGNVLSMHADSPEKFTARDVFSTCITNIGAGSDTTSISISSIMLGLIQNPNAFAKLRAEVDERTSSGEVSSTITFQQAQKMPYLQACIKEGLRIHPATGLPLGRVVPKGGATIAGQFFPEGTIVGVNTWVAHRNKDIFGLDADIFRPERWLEDPERATIMERYWIPFGHGARTCIGKNISLMEISKLIPKLVRNFDFALAEPSKEVQGENNWFVQQKDFWCTISARGVE